MQIIRITRDSTRWHEPFFAHMREVFPGIDFKPWHRAGCWSSCYNVTALASEDDLIATVGRTQMVLSLAGGGADDGLIVHGEAIQLGAVAVKARYRNAGHGRRLMEVVVDEADRAGLPLFLFSNRTACGFYDRLGFVATKSDQVVGNLRVAPGTRPARRLDPHHDDDRRVILDAAASSSSHHGGLAARPDAAILLWYLYNTPVRAMEIESDGSVVFVEQEADGTLVVREWLGRRTGDFRPLLPCIIKHETSRIVFGFIPQHAWMEFGLEIVPDPGSYLYLRSMPVPTGPLCFPHLLRT